MTSLKSLNASVLGAALVVVAVGAAHADTIDMVPVGNAGNDGVWAGKGYGGIGDPRLCGAVGYDYQIGKYEVTAGQYAEFLNAVAKADPYALYDPQMSSSSYGCKIQRSGSGTSGDPYVYSVTDGHANGPVNYISWGSAARFANWLTNGQPTGPEGPSTTEDGSYCLNGLTDPQALLAVTRKQAPQAIQYVIPTENEWFKAAYHKNDGLTANYWTYATQGELPPNNTPSQTEPGHANYYRSGYSVGDPNDQSDKHMLSDVGAFKASPSAYGTFDQSGNVWEWNETVIDVSGGSTHGLRGGSFNLGSSCLAASRDIYDPGQNYYNVGFRVAAVANVPEPGTLALLAAGAGVLLIWRVRRKEG